jgi:hypothetical protein
LVKANKKSLEQDLEFEPEATDAGEEESEVELSENESGSDFETTAGLTPTRAGFLGAQKRRPTTRSSGRTKKKDLAVKEAVVVADDEENWVTDEGDEPDRESWSDQEPYDVEMSLAASEDSSIGGTDWGSVDADGGEVDLDFVKFGISDDRAAKRAGDDLESPAKRRG